jgi:hypothetical protein
VKAGGFYASEKNPLVHVAALAVWRSPRRRADADRLRSLGPHKMLKKRQHGEKIEVPKERTPAKVVNLMEALRQSLKAEGGSRAKPAARSVQHRTGAKKEGRSRQRKAGQAAEAERQTAVMDQLTSPSVPFEMKSRQLDNFSANLHTPGWFNGFVSWAGPAPSRRVNHQPGKL